MGTALSVAQKLEQELVSNGHEVELIQDFRAGQLSENAEDVLLICTSNTGMGDLPANIQGFYQHLTSDFPAIHNRRFGSVTLGDSSYPNFAQAGTTLTDALVDLGCVQLGDALILDAIETDTPEEDAAAWLKSWMQLL